MGEGFVMQMLSMIMTQQKDILEIENENIDVVAKVSRNMTRLSYLWAFVGILNLYYAGMAIWRDYAVPRVEIRTIALHSQTGAKRPAGAEPSWHVDNLPGTSQQVSLHSTPWGCGE